LIPTFSDIVKPENVLLFYENDITHDDEEDDELHSLRTSQATDEDAEEEVGLGGVGRGEHKHRGVIIPKLADFGTAQVTPHHTHAKLATSHLACRIMIV